MYLDDIPSEIWLEIVQFCSPRDLASLSRVHSSLRNAAEYVLYTHIYYSAHPFDLIQDRKGKSSNPWTLKEHKSLLHTLTTSARLKAKMVKSLHVELHGSSDHGEAASENATRFILIKLSQLLKDMPNLVDFRIIYDLLDDPSNLERLSEVIRGCHFRLHTLWLYEGHDLKGIVTNQPNLRFLGVYYRNADTNKHFWRKIKGLFQTVPSPRMMPTICMLGCYSPWTPMIEIFPASHRLGEVVPECQEIARSLMEFPANYFRRHECNLTFDLFRITKGNINLLGEVMEGIATSIQSYTPSPTIRFLEFTIDNPTIKPWHIPGFIRALPLFENVENIGFKFRGIREDELGPFYTDIHLCLMKDLGKVWPKVRRVRVRRRFTCVLLDRDSDWSPIGDAFWDSDEDLLSDSS